VAFDPVFLSRLQFGMPCSVLAGLSTGTRDPFASGPTRVYPGLSEAWSRCWALRSSYLLR
jgi:hypothetical protein